MSHSLQNMPRVKSHVTSARLNAKKRVTVAAISDSNDKLEIVQQDSTDDADLAILDGEDSIDDVSLILNSSDDIDCGKGYFSEFSVCNIILCFKLVRGLTIKTRGCKIVPGIPENTTLGGYRDVYNVTFGPTGFFQDPSG